jgi:hypothetical protein
MSNKRFVDEPPVLQRALRWSEASAAGGPGDDSSPKA